MDSFLMSVGVVVPLCVYMFVGFLIRKRGIFSRENFRKLNGLLFQIFIPMTLFCNIYNADVGVAVQPKLFAGIIIGVLIIFAMTWIIISKMISEISDRTVMIQGIYRSNYVLFGTTIASHLCGTEGVGVISALAAFVVPLYNILAVILFETHRGGKIQIKQLIINIFKNPLVDAGVLGLIFSALNIRIPDMIFMPITKMANAATPMALVALGGMLSVGSMIRDKNYLILAAFGRLIFVPLVAVMAAILLGVRGDVLVAIMAIFGSPTAVASGPMAQALGGNGELAGEIVAVTAVMCIFSIFLFVFVLLNLGFI